MIERRYETQERANIQVIGQMGWLRASLRNLSKTGACIEFEDEQVFLRKGDVVSMSLNLLSVNKRYNMSAEVVWRKGNRSGLQFITPDRVMNRLMRR